MLFSVSLSGMPNKACTFPGTTKNVHIFCLLLCSIFTLHLPNCVIIVLSYVFNWMLLFLVVADCSFVALGNSLVHKCKGIMFLSLPVSTLYGTTIETWLDNVLDSLLLPTIYY